MNNEGRFRELIQTFDISELRQLTTIMESGFEESELLDMAGRIANLRQIPTADGIADTISGIVDADRTEFFAHCGSTPYGYVDSMDYAYEWILNHIRDEYIETANIMKIQGLNDELNSMMLSIADALDLSKGLVRDESPDSCTQLAGNIRKCVEEGEPMDGFEW